MKTEEILDLFSPKNNDIKTIIDVFSNVIRPLSRTNYPKAETKIKNRLKTYNVDQIIDALKRFSNDDWWMKNNGNRPLDWYFHSDERIEQFLLLDNGKPSWKIGNHIYYSVEELTEAEKKGEIKYGPSGFVPR